MFSLIITVVSLLLVAGLAAATLFFGGDQFLQGKTDAEVARYVSESQQIAGAVQLFQAENQGSMPTDLKEDLVGYYLKDLPRAGEGWSVGDNLLVKGVTDKSTCERVNERGNWTNPTWSENPLAAGKYEPIACAEADALGKSSSYYCCVAAAE